MTEAKEFKKPKKASKIDPPGDYQDSIKIDNRRFKVNRTPAPGVGIMSGKYRLMSFKVDKGGFPQEKPKDKLFSSLGEIKQYVEEKEAKKPGKEGFLIYDETDLG